MTLREELLESAGLNALATLVAIKDGNPKIRRWQLESILQELRHSLDYGGAMENKE